MPITDFQRRILLLLKKHRNPNSYVAGGIAIHRDASSRRESNDIDFFHETDEAVTLSATLDIGVLQQNGFSVNTLISQPSFVRVVVSAGRANSDNQSLKLEWVRDTAFRFFPVIEDADLGFRLHDVDLAVNKCLALANRSEVRDIIDLLQLQDTTISIASACWAACGKDPGFTPALLFDCMRRHSIIRPEQLAAEKLSWEISAVELKRTWISQLENAEQKLAQYTPTDLGCIYLDRSGSVMRDPEPSKLVRAIKHFCSVGGSWPRIVSSS